MEPLGNPMSVGMVFLHPFDRRGSEKQSHLCAQRLKDMLGTPLRLTPAPKPRTTPVKGLPSLWSSAPPCNSLITEGMLGVGERQASSMVRCVGSTALPRGLIARATSCVSSGKLLGLSVPQWIQPGQWGSF